jgi:hypothetical protein
VGIIQAMFEYCPGIHHHGRHSQLTLRNSFLMLWRCKTECYYALDTI